MIIFREKIFGPVVVIPTFETAEQAIRKVSNSVPSTGPKMESGMGWINSSDDSDSCTPFGGIKQSGIGRKLGEAGLAAYCSINSCQLGCETV
ncbi:hypothetical protein ASPNIDRAFT_142824, partial [Aspergillus niger ATCC 1015]